jgi:hypothetical protein
MQKNDVQERELKRAIAKAVRTGESRINAALARYYLLTRYGVQMDEHEEGVSLMQRYHDGYFTDVQFGDIDWPNATENFAESIDSFIGRRRAWRFWSN